MLVDAATLYYRAFYALPDSITAPDGTPVNAVRGFFDGLRTLRDRYSPDVIVACWDGRETGGTHATVVMAVEAHKYVYIVPAIPMRRGRQ